MVEGVLVGIDVGTSKVCALIGEVSRDGKVTVIGHGTVPSSGLKKGAVVNIDQTVRSIADARNRLDELKMMTVPSNKFDTVPLEDATGGLRSGQALRLRSHRSGRLAAPVSFRGG